MIKPFLLGIFLFVCSINYAQSDTFRAAFEMGIMGGGSYYIGDLNPKTHFKYSDWAGGLIVRYNLSNRHSFRMTASYGNIYGDDSKSKDAYQINRNLSFYSNIIEIAAGFEIDLVKYRINDMKYPISPYFFYEIAYFRMNPKVKDEFGNEIILQELGTEGQGTILNSKKPYNLNQISIPLGIGVKFNLKERLAISIEYGIRKTFTDYIDDVSGKYVNPLALQALKGPLASQLADPSLNHQSYFSEGMNRGNSRTKDWYSMYGLMITFKPWEINICAMQGMGKGKRRRRR